MASLIGQDLGYTFRHDSGWDLSLLSLIFRRLYIGDSLHGSPKIANSKGGSPSMWSHCKHFCLYPFNIYSIVKASHSQAEVQGMEVWTWQLPGEALKYHQHFFFFSVACSAFLATISQYSKLHHPSALKRLIYKKKFESIVLDSDEAPWCSSWSRNLWIKKIDRLYALYTSNIQCWHTEKLATIDTTAQKVETSMAIIDL